MSTMAGAGGASGLGPEDYEDEYSQPGVYESRMPPQVSQAPVATSSALAGVGGAPSVSPAGEAPPPDTEALYTVPRYSYSSTQGETGAEPVSPEVLADPGTGQDAGPPPGPTREALGSVGELLNEIYAYGGQVNLRAMLREADAMGASPRDKAVLMAAYRSHSPGTPGRMVPGGWVPKGVRKQRGPGYGQETEGAILSAMGEQAQATARQMEASRAFAEQKAMEEQAAQQERLNVVQAQNAEIEEKRTALQNEIRQLNDEWSTAESIDPNRFWKRMSGPVKFLSMIGMVMNAFGGGTDAVFRIFQAQQDADIQAQRDEIRRIGDKAKTKRNALAKFDESHGSPEAREQLVRAGQFAVFEAKLRQQLARAQKPEVAARIDEALARFKGARLEHMAKYEQMMTPTIIEETAYQPARYVGGTPAKRLSPDELLKMHEKLGTGIDSRNMEPQEKLQLRNSYATMPNGDVVSLNKSSNPRLWQETARAVTMVTNNLARQDQIVEEMRELSPTSMRRKELYDEWMALASANDGVVRHGIVKTGVAVGEKEQESADTLSGAFAMPNWKSMVRDVRRLKSFTSAARKALHGVFSTIAQEAWVTKRNPNQDMVLPYIPTGEQFRDSISYQRAIKGDPAQATTTPWLRGVGPYPGDVEDTEEE